MTVSYLLLQLLISLFSKSQSRIAQCLLAVSNLESRTLDGALSVFAQKSRARSEIIPLYIIFSAM